MNNLWLNPALLRQARAAAPLSIGRDPASVAFDAPGPQAASGAAQNFPQDWTRPAAAAHRERCASTRRLCLRLAALALLGGSAAFSYVAWSDEMREGHAQRGRPVNAMETPTDNRFHDTSTPAG